MDDGVGNFGLSGEMKNHQALVWDTAISMATATSRGGTGDIFSFEGNKVFVELLAELRNASQSLIYAVEAGDISEMGATMIWDAANRIMVATANPYLVNRDLIGSLVDRLKNGYLTIMADDCLVE